MAGRFQYISKREEMFNFIFGIIIAFGIIFVAYLFGE